MATPLKSMKISGKSEKSAENAETILPLSYCSLAILSRTEHFEFSMGRKGQKGAEKKMTDGQQGGKQATGHVKTGHKSSVFQTQTLHLQHE